VTIGLSGLYAHHFSSKWEVGSEGEEVHSYPIWSIQKGMCSRRTWRRVCDCNRVPRCEFLEQEIPSKSEVRQDSVLYELDESAPSNPDEQKNFEPIPPGNIGSNNLVDDAVSTSHESQTLRRSNHSIIPCHCSEIKREVWENMKPRCEWGCKGMVDAMKDKIESMWTNQVWDLVGILVGCKAIRNKWVLKMK